MVASFRGCDNDRGEGSSRDHQARLWGCMCLLELPAQIPLPGRLKPQTFTVSQPGRQKSEIKVSTGLVPPGASLLAWGCHLLPMSSRGLPSLCVCVLISYPIRMPGRLH